MIHAFLLVGQSNMAGRGFPHEVDPIENKDIRILRNGRWWPMYVPVNPDRVTAGINLAELACLPAYVVVVHNLNYRRKELCRCIG